MCIVYDIAEVDEVDGDVFYVFHVVVAVDVIGAVDVAHAFDVVDFYHVIVDAVEFVM